MKSHVRLFKAVILPSTACFEEGQGWIMTVNIVMIKADIMGILVFCYMSMARVARLEQVLDGGYLAARFGS
jgi:hypothetical protein